MNTSEFRMFSPTLSDEISILARATTLAAIKLAARSTIPFNVLSNKRPPLNKDYQLWLKPMSNPITPKSHVNEFWIRVGSNLSKTQSPEELKVDKLIFEYLWDLRVKRLSEE